MKTLYCALGYACNERCRFCPCSEGSTSLPSFNLNEIKEAIDCSIDEKGVENILLSGGEPTIHPDFFKVIEHVASKNVRLSILTNAIKLANKEFVDKIFELIDASRVDVTVAFHSHIPEKHDFLTQVKGSYEKSLLGVKRLIEKGVIMSVKNNIVNYTYRDLPAYIEWVNDTFPEEVTLLLCNIDVNGTAQANKDAVGVSFLKSREYLEKALDRIIELRKEGVKRTTKVLTTPLCMIDPYYWGFVETQTQANIDAYKVPCSDGDNGPLMFDVSSDSGPMFKACDACDVKDYCPGTWRSFRDNYDETMLKSIFAERSI